MIFEAEIWHLLSPALIVYSINENLDFLTRRIILLISTKVLSIMSQSNDENQIS